MGQDGRLTVRMFDGASLSMLGDGADQVPSFGDP